MTCHVIILGKKSPSLGEFASILKIKKKVVDAKSPCEEISFPVPVDLPIIVMRLQVFRPHGKSLSF